MKYVFLLLSSTVTKDKQFEIYGVTFLGLICASYPMLPSGADVDVISVSRFGLKLSVFIHQFCKKFSVQMW